MPVASLSEYELQDSFPLWYLVMKQGWFPETRGASGIYTGECKWHSENSGSLVVYPDHIHCFSGSCTAHGDIVRIIGVLEFGLSFKDRKIPAQVFARRDELLREFEGPRNRAVPLLLPAGQERNQVRLRKTLSIPGPLHRIVLTRVTTWWHEQLQANNPQAARVRRYLRERGVSDFVIERCPVVGYMPYSSDLHWRQSSVFDELCRVTEEELAQERQWYRDLITWQQVSDEHLNFLRSSRTFERHLGLLTDTGRWRLAGRLLFSSQNARGHTCFYQGRILPCSKQNRYKFLNPPGIEKYPFQVDLGMLVRGEEPVLKPRMPGTLEVESPFGPLVSCSYRLCQKAFATLGESTPNSSFLAGLEEPIWRAHDNDEVQVKNGIVSFPGGQQDRLYQEYYTDHHQWSERLLPWKQYKGMDEWLKGVGAKPVQRTMRRILARHQEREICQRSRSMA